MTYRYIERTYGTKFQPGDRVRNSETGQTGRVVAARGDPQYYHVRHDGQSHTSKWHPAETLIDEVAPC